MSKISDIAPYLRPREKALSSGFASLSDKELLAIFIRSGTKALSALDIAESILKTHNSLDEICHLDIYDLMKVKGIKKAKAIEIAAIVEIVKRIGVEKGRKIVSIKNCDDVYNLFASEVENYSQEHFIVLFLNIKLSIIRKEVLFIGGENSAFIDVNLLFKKAIKYGAKKIICIHNHPSGDPFPSNEDVNLTNKIREVSKIVGVELLDHIIIGHKDYFSFKQMNI